MNHGQHIARGYGVARAHFQLEADSRIDILILTGPPTAHRDDTMAEGAGIDP